MTRDQIVRESVVYVKGFAMGASLALLFIADVWSWYHQVLYTVLCSYCAVKWMFTP